jgi:RNA-directed DNA polymerase
MRFKAKIKAMTKRGATLNGVRDKIEAMNYLVRGWANYFRHQAASKTFRYVGHYAFKRMEIWLRKKTGQRIRAIYRRYYRRHHSYLTWCVGDMALYNPDVETKIKYLRYAHRPNPYLVTPQEVLMSYHLSPFPGTRDWQGAHPYGEAWTEIRAQVPRRDGWKCRICGKGERIEVHHIRPWQAGMTHELSNLITLCAACHRQIRNPESAASRKLAGIIP